MVTLRPIDPDGTPNEVLLDYPDCTIYQTREWLAFVAECQGAEPVRAEVLQDGVCVGFFTGLVMNKLGLRILGSPFPGWTTQYMGFCLRPGIPRAPVLEAMPYYAFKQLGCVYLEVSDPYLAPSDAANTGFGNEPFPTYVSDLTLDEEALLASMRDDVRWSIRRATRVGTVIRHATDLKAFAELFHEQLKDVFDKQGLLPTYGLDRVQSLIKWLHPTGNLLLLEAAAPDGEVIATGIYVGMGQHAQFWGNASLRSGQKQRPNEIMHWEAMLYWKARGAKVFDWGGLGGYKEKYGCVRVDSPRFVKSRFPGLSTAKKLARASIATVNRLAARHKRE